MENALVLGKTEIFNDFVKSKFKEKILVPEIFRINPVLENIRVEGGTDFIQYVDFLQLTNEPNLMALSSSHHYYYDFNDLKSIKTLINLKKLNNVKHLESFLSIVSHILPQKANFIGYFKNDTGNRTVFSFYQTTKLFDGLVNYLDSKTYRSLTKEGVSRLLEQNKLEVIDITDINGLTYFCSRNCR